MLDVVNVSANAGCHGCGPLVVSMMARSIFSWLQDACAFS